MEQALLCPTQARQYGTVIDDIPPDQDHTGTSTFSVHVSDSVDTIFPLSRHGPTAYLAVRRPTQAELETLPVIDITEEEEQVGGGADSTPGPSPSAGLWNDDASPSPTISSASWSAPPPTARDLQRVKRGLVRATEHLRESLADTKGRIWEIIEDEVQERKQEALTL